MADRVNASLNSETGSVRRYSHVRRWGAGLFVALLVTAASSSTAQAASVALGTADSFAVLAAQRDLTSAYKRRRGTQLHCLQGNRVGTVRRLTPTAIPTRCSSFRPDRC